MTFQFDPPDGYRNLVRFPTTPASEADFRDSMQKLFDQLRDELNSGASSAIGIRGMGEQVIINGNFNRWEKGLNFTSQGYTADRWITDYDGSGVTISVTRQIMPLGDLSDKSKYFLRYQVTTAGSGNTIHRLSQKIEGVRLFAGQKCTPSLYAKADISRNVKLSFDQNFGSGGSPTLFNAGGLSANFSLGTTWTKVAYPVQLPSIAGKTIGTDDNLRLIITMPGNSTFTIDIAEVELNEGDTALPFQPRHIGEEYNLCTRYNYRIAADASNLFQPMGVGYANATTQAKVFIPTPKMRVSPTPTFNSLALSIGSSLVAVTGISVDAGGTNGINLLVNVASGLTVGAPVILVSSGTSAGYLNLDSEL